MRRKIFFFLAIFCLLFIHSNSVFAQVKPTSLDSLNETRVATDEASEATKSAKKDKIIKEEDITKPEEEEAKKEFLELFSKRPIEDISVFNLAGYTVQYAVRSGVPANTIILILLLPVLATGAVFFRQIIGLPTLEVLVPIAFSITLVATGAAAGVILLATILFASILARLILKKIRIMQLPKLALSTFLVSICVFLSLTASASLGLITVQNLSFLPVLLLILLSDKIVALHLARGSKTAIIITFFTLLLGALGFILLSVAAIRNYILLYPEIIFLLIPINLILGRYFGLRLTEYHRFATFRKYVNQ